MTPQELGDMWLWFRDNCGTLSDNELHFKIKELGKRQSKMTPYEWTEFVIHIEG